MPLTQVLRGSSPTLLAKAVAIGIPFPSVYRHMPVLRRCLGYRDRPLLVAPCSRVPRPGGRFRLNNLLLLTRDRLVVTTERGLLRRLRLHLNVNLSQLTDVAWSPEPERGGVQLSATAVDGVREHFWIRLGAPELVWRLDGLLRDIFTPRPRWQPRVVPQLSTAPAGTPRTAPQRRVASAA